MAILIPPSIPLNFPLTAVVGQDAIKLALLLAPASAWPLFCVAQVGSLAIFIS
jgi:hypothetical protein